MGALFVYFVIIKEIMKKTERVNITERIASLLCRFKALVLRLRCERTVSTEIWQISAIES